MDAELLQQIKTVTNIYKTTSEVLPSLGDIQNKINVLASNLFKLKVEKVTDCITYTHQQNILKSVYDLANITLILIKAQQKQIDFTNKAMRAKDDSEYFLPKDDIRIGEFIIEENSDLNNAILRILTKRKNDYIEAFGYYKDEKTANKIIKKEYDDVSHYLDMLLKVNELKYSDFDNYDPLINGCQNLIYELSQLVINLIKAEESKIVDVVDKIDENNCKGYFILMDFINSSTLFFNRWGLLVDNINRINNILMREKTIGLLCKMNLYKQDEAQGIFIGDIERFIDVLKTELISDIKVAFSKFDIFDKEKGLIDITDSVYDNSYMLSGIPAWNARNMLNNSPLLVRVNK